MKRLILLVASCFLICIVAVTGYGGCKGVTLNIPKLPGFGTNQALQTQVPGVGLVILELTYPAGQSPKVFTKGWVFGARCLINPGKPDQKDISDQVKWSGSGSFDPATGPLSHPSFAGEGSNIITLTVPVGNQTLSKPYTVSAVSPANYAHIDSQAWCPADGHGDPGDPHPVRGKITVGSLNVQVDGKPAARVGDTGIHCCCGGPNTFEIVQGDSNVLIDGKPSARYGDQTKHCGGIGKIVNADFKPPSTDTPVGNTQTGAGQNGAAGSVWVLQSVTPTIRKGIGNNVVDFTVKEGSYSSSEIMKYDSPLAHWEATSIQAGTWTALPKVIKPDEKKPVTLTASITFKIRPQTKWGGFSNWFYIADGMTNLATMTLNANSDLVDPPQTKTAELYFPGKAANGSEREIIVRFVTGTGSGEYRYKYVYQN